MYVCVCIYIYVYIYTFKKKGLVLEGNFSFCFLCLFSNGAEVMVRYGGSMVAYGSSKLLRSSAINRALLRACAAPANPVLRDPMPTPV